MKERQRKTVAIVSILLGISVLLPILGFTYVLVSIFPFLSFGISPVALLLIPIFFTIGIGIWRNKKWGIMTGIIVYLIFSLIFTLFCLMNVISGGIGYIVFELPFIIFLLIFYYCLVTLCKIYKINKRQIV